MPAFKFTATASSDELSRDDGGGPVAHGLTTGEGPLTAIVAGGSLGGLLTSADYYAIRIDDTTFQLATSSANAIAGTPVVDITSDIVGVIGVGLPFRRVRTYAAGSQVKSADLNALQDSSVDHMHGLDTLVVPAQRWVPQGTQDPLSYSVGAATGTDAGGIAALCGFEVQKGSTLFEVRVRLKPATGDVLRVRLFAIIDDDGGTTELAGPTDTVGTDWQWVTFSNLNHDIVDGAMYSVRVSRQSGSAADDSLGQVEVDSYKIA